MAEKFYEKHKTDTEQPIILHLDTLGKNGFLKIDISDKIFPRFHVHWHENIELLYVTQGECDISTNAVKIHAVQGELAIINSNMVHQVEATTDFVKYYCLIVDVTFCKNIGIDIENTVFRRLIPKSEETSGLFLEVVRCAGTESEYKNLELKLSLFALLLHLLKEHKDDEFSSHKYSNPKAEIAKKAIEYMKLHYAEPLTVSGIAASLGFTKYYFCHVFSEITGSTVINHLNYIRCKNARKLISSGKCNITEAAEQCGFTNMSYFAKIYKSIIGQLPSETKAEAKKE